MFAYTRFHSNTEIYHHGKLVIKENLLMTPAGIPVHAIGMMEGFTHQASLLCWKESVCSPSLMNGLHALLDGVPGISAGISSVSADALVIRLLGHKAEQLFNLVKKAADFISVAKVREIKSVL